jgi:hypothetical protein
MFPVNLEPWSVHYLEVLRKRYRCSTFQRLSDVLLVSLRPQASILMPPVTKQVLVSHVLPQDAIPILTLIHIYPSAKLIFESQGHPEVLHTLNQSEPGTKKNCFLSLLLRACIPFSNRSLYTVLVMCNAMFLWSRSLRRSLRHSMIWANRVLGVARTVKTSSRGNL